MLDYAEYTIDGDGYQGNGHNGYDKLEGEWLTYYKVGKGFTGKVKPEDREDFLHDLFLAFARVKTSYQDKGKELTIGGLVRIAQYQVADYWRKCKEDNLYGSKCPKAIQLESLDTLVEDGNGDSTPLHELIADDNADFIPRLDARLILDSYPKRFVQLAYKKFAGYQLTGSEHNYYYRELKKAQKSLV